jgi:hypothetical protein
VLIARRIGILSTSPVTERMLISADQTRTDHAMLAPA